jgi:hypothetical protein
MPSWVMRVQAELKVLYPHLLLEMPQRESF